MDREVDTIAKKVSKILDRNNIDPDSKGGRAQHRRPLRMVRRL